MKKRITEEWVLKELKKKRLWPLKKGDNENQFNFERKVNLILNRTEDLVKASLMYDWICIKRRKAIKEFGANSEMHLNWSYLEELVNEKTCELRNKLGIRNAK